MPWGSPVLAVHGITTFLVCIFPSRSIFWVLRNKSLRHLLNDLAQQTPHLQVSKLSWCQCPESSQSPSPKGLTQLCFQILLQSSVLLLDSRMYAWVLWDSYLHLDAFHIWTSGAQLHSGCSHWSKHYLITP